MAYEPLAVRMIEPFGRDFELIGTVGSGGSTCGLIQRLRWVNSDLKLTGVDTFGSVLFGLANSKRQLREVGILQANDRVMLIGTGNVQHEPVFKDETDSIKSESES